MAIFVGIKIVLDFQRQSCIANTVTREGEWIYKTTNIVNERVDDSIIWNQRPVYINKAATHNYTCCFYKSINSNVVFLTLVMMAESISNSLTDTGSVVMAVDYSDNSEWAFDCKYMYIQDCFSEKKVCLIHHVLKKNTSCHQMYM